MPAKITTQWNHGGKKPTKYIRKVSCDVDRPYFEDSYSILSDLIGIDFGQDSKDTGSGIGDLILDSFPVFAFFKSAVENIGDSRVTGK